MSTAAAPISLEAMAVFQVPFTLNPHPYMDRIMSDNDKVADPKHTVPLCWQEFGLPPRIDDRAIFQGISLDTSTGIGKHWLSFVSVQVTAVTADTVTFNAEGKFATMEYDIYSHGRGRVISAPRLLKQVGDSILFRGFVQSHFDSAIQRYVPGFYIDSDGDIKDLSIAVARETQMLRVLAKQGGAAEQLGYTSPDEMIHAILGDNSKVGITPETLVSLHKMRFK